MRRVLVFKTSVDSSEKRRIAENLLNSLLNQSETWNFDLEDCDRILRVEADSVEPGAIIENLKTGGIACSELEEELIRFDKEARRSYIWDSGFKRVSY